MLEIQHSLRLMTGGGGGIEGINCEGNGNRPKALKALKQDVLKESRGRPAQPECWEQEGGRPAEAGAEASTSPGRAWGPC